jgi:hypothetical protein
MPSTISYTNTLTAATFTKLKFGAKTNMRLGNDGLVITNISRLLKTRSLNNQVYADAHALSEAFFKS